MAGKEPAPGVSSCLPVKRGLPPGAKEALEQGRALLFQRAAGDLWAPVAGGLVENLGAMDHRAPLGIAGGEHQAADAGVADSPGAHGAGLQSDHQRQASQAIITQGLGRLPQGENLGVGGRIVTRDRGVMGGGDDLAGGRVQHHRADWRLAGVGGGLRLLKGDAHGAKIMVDHKREPNPRAATRQAPAAAVDGERVAKALARAGVASRREVERLIAAGRVALNGKVLDTPAVKVGPGDLLTVDGALVGEAEPTRVWRYHKPTGLVTTHRDPKGRATVFEHLPEGLPRVISVGRLDLNSEGLLLLTNDGGLARALELPSNGLVRRYRARARGHTTQARLDELSQGLTVEGVHYGPIEAHLDKAREGAQGANLWITLTLTEGKNREVRKVLEALGLTVNRLIRLSYGPFQLGTLEVGAVEEVGPRVIREQLAAHIAPGALPSATRPAAVAASPPRSAGREDPAGRAAARGARRGMAPAREGGKASASGHDDLRMNHARPMKRDRFKTSERDADGKPLRASPRPAQDRPGASGRETPAPARGKISPKRRGEVSPGVAPAGRPEAAAKTDYKPGWAKPKKRPTRPPPKTSRGPKPARPGEDPARSGPKPRR